MIILVEIHVKGFLWKCAKKTSIYGQNQKVANSERYWTLLTKEKLSGVHLILPNISGNHITICQLHITILSPRVRRHFQPAQMILP